MLTIEFSTPFTRSQLRATVGNLNFPTLTFGFRQNAAITSAAATPDAEDDLISALKVDGFTTIQEVGTFLSALPAGANGRITEIAYQ